MPEQRLWYSKHMSPSDVSDHDRVNGVFQALQDLGP